MAFDWEHVEAIRAEQNSARAKRDTNILPTDGTSERIYDSPIGIDAKVPKLDHWEQMIQKVRTQLIDYIISHGLVQGFEYDGINEPIKNGKIVLTADMLKRVTDQFGYFREKETKEFIETYLPEHFYVADENYVHTDNNYTNAEKDKLSGVADGAEVNKVVSILFNGVETIDPETRVATITITPADVKVWYEQNPDTNVFTDAEKAKLESINIDALSNKVEDVTLDGETIVKNKIAVLTAKKIKDSYENNPDTNAFTDADKALVEQVLPEIQKGVNQHEQRIDALEKSQTVQDAEIADTKNSISELGDEVNSVAGRVTNLEGSQKVQDGKISALEQKNTEQDERLDTLETSDTKQNADILQLKEDVKNAGKIDDVQVDGTSVVVDKVAKIPYIPTNDDILSLVAQIVADNYIPYTGANKEINIGRHGITAKGEDLSTGFYADNVFYQSGIGYQGYNADGNTFGFGGISSGYLSPGYPYTELCLFNTIPPKDDKSATLDAIRIALEQVGSGASILRLIGKQNNQDYDFKLRGVGSPILDKDATNKKYVDDKIATLKESIDSLTARIAALENK